jgi:hypothetical protein
MHLHGHLGVVVVVVAMAAPCIVAMSEHACICSFFMAPALIKRGVTALCHHTSSSPRRLLLSFLFSIHACMDVPHRVSIAR